MEQFSKTIMGKFAVTTAKDEFEVELTQLILCNLAFNYYEYIGEKAVDIYNDLAKHNKDLNEIELREIAQAKTTQFIAETINVYPKNLTDEELEAAGLGSLMQQVDKSDMGSEDDFFKALHE